MRLRFQPWQVALLVVALCVAIIGGIWWYRSRGVATPDAMLACLPRGDGTLVYIDVALLRESHLLDLIVGSRAAEELEYKQFVDQSGFDYRRDLDGVAAAFVRDEVYLVLRGRFDWRKLTAYTTAHGGTCHNSFCRASASRPGRFISFYPLRSATMALAMSGDDWAATNIAVRRLAPPGPNMPEQPVWISLPASTLHEAKDLPAGARSYTSALAGAKRLTFAIGPQGDRLEVTAEVACDNPEAARGLVAQLTQTTDLLRKMLAREKKTPNPADLSGVLAGGSFRSVGEKVVANWPVERVFVETLAGGPAQ